MLAGAYIGIGVLIMTTAGGPLVAAANPFAPLVAGLVFGVALTIVVVAGAELATSSMMYLTHGAMLHRIALGTGRWRAARHPRREPARRDRVRRPRARLRA